jgi:hypothetical protein
MSRSSIFSSSPVATDGPVIRQAAAGLARWLALALPLAALLNHAYGLLPLTKVDRKMGRFEREAPRVQILGLGSSRMEAAFDPRHLRVPALNMGGGAQDLYYDAQIALHRLDRTRNLRAVVWGIDQWAFGYDMALLSKADTVLPLYDRYFPRRRAGDVDLKTRIQRHLPLFRARGSDPIVTSLLLFRSWTGVPDASEEKDRLAGLVDSDDGATIAAYHRREFFRPERQAEGLTIAIDAIRRLQQAGVHVTIVTMPVMPSYLAALAPDMARSFQTNRAQLLQQTGADHLDLSQHFQRGTGHFADSGHLSPKGAKAFTQLIATHLAPRLAVSR